VLQRRRRRWRHAALGAATVTPALGVGLMHPVIKGPGFHHYADARAVLGIPNAGDVLSNLPFVIVGVLGLLVARKVEGLPRGLVALFFAGVLAIGVGSGAYHAHPIDATLAFDWLPIVLALAWLTALVVADRVDRRLGTIAAYVLPLAAVGSVLFWWLGGGTVAGGDMRWYGFVQLLFVAMVPLIVLLYPQGALDRRLLLLAVASFVLARVVNKADHQILDAIGVSGHSLKHLAAGMAAWFVLRAIRSVPTAAPSPAHR
jgi:hypothetical protein